MILKGKVIKYGDNVDTDVIIPARYLVSSVPEELAAHCMEDLDPDFHDKIGTASVIVAGKNFGCGSSREHAPIAIKASGVKCVIAKSFARIFYRNAINIGLPIFECDYRDGIRENDEIEVDTEKGVVRNLSDGLSFDTQNIPPFIEKIIRAGGLLEIR